MATTSSSGKDRTGHAHGWNRTNDGARMGGTARTQGPVHTAVPGTHERPGRAPTEPHLPILRDLADSACTRHGA